MAIDNVIDFIKINKPKSAMDIRESLLLLNDMIRTTSMQIWEDTGKLYANNDYAKIRELTDQVEEINKIQQLIEGYINKLEMDEQIEDKLIHEEQVEAEKAKKNIPNYNDYVVDSEVPYSLYDSFTHKCPAAFSLGNEKVVAKQWKDVLLLTCGKLADINPERFISFASDPSLQGKKVNYISTSQQQMRKPVKLDKYDIYIETNMSANSIRNLLVKLLKKFEIKLSDYKIYLRADYTDLHE